MFIYKKMQKYKKMHKISALINFVLFFWVDVNQKVLHSNKLLNIYL